LPSTPQERADAGQQFLEVERLGEIVVRPSVERGHFAPGVVARRQHQDRQHAVDRADMGEHLVPVDPGEDDVEQHEIDRPNGDQLYRLLAAASADHLVAGGVQAALEQAYDGGIVFDDQDPHAATGQVSRTTPEPSPVGRVCRTLYTIRAYFRRQKWDRAV
jgi:hypothetical protein